MSAILAARLTAAAAAYHNGAAELLMTDDEYDADHRLPIERKAEA